MSPVFPEIWLNYRDAINFLNALKLNKEVELPIQNGTLCLNYPFIDLDMSAVLNVRGRQLLLLPEEITKLVAASQQIVRQMRKHVSACGYGVQHVIKYKTKTEMENKSSFAIDVGFDGLDNFLILRTITTILVLNQKESLNFLKFLLSGFKINENQISWIYQNKNRQLILETKPQKMQIKLN